MVAVRGCGSAEGDGPRNRFLRRRFVAIGRIGEVERDGSQVIVGAPGAQSLQKIMNSRQIVSKRAMKESHG